MKGISEQLSRFAADLSFEDLSPEVIHEVKRRVIDSLGCMAGAIGSPPARAAQSLARSVRSRPGSTLLGSKSKTAPDLAAFANGVLVRYLDYNDTYLSKEPAHPSDNIPAALAVGEAERADGKKFIEAVVVGYEIQCRLCDAASLRARGWDHVTYGLFSTGLLSGKLMGLTREQMMHAVSIAGTAHIALRQTRVGELSMWKGCAFAEAARNGVFAARLAREGMTGPSRFFEGERGFFRQVSGPFELPSLGGKENPLMVLQTAIKFYPAEYHAQSAIDAALAIRREWGNLKNIRKIKIKTFQAAVDIIGHEPEKWKPQSRETADHSLPYCVAAALTDGTITEEQFDPSRFRDPEILALVDRIEVHKEDALDPFYPEGIPNLLEITLDSGETLSKRVDYPRGHARNPLSDAEVEKKFLHLCNGKIRKPDRRKLLDLVWNLETLPGLEEIVSRMRQSG